MPSQGQDINILISSLHSRKRGEKRIRPWLGTETGLSLTTSQRRKGIFAVVTLCEPSTLGEPIHNSEMLPTCISKRLRWIKLSWLKRLPLISWREEQTLGPEGPKGTCQRWLTMLSRCLGMLPAAMLPFANRLCLAWGCSQPALGQPAAMLSPPTKFG